MGIINILVFVALLIMWVAIPFDPGGKLFITVISCGIMWVINKNLAHDRELEN